MVRRMYHTQEKRARRLRVSVETVRSDAWLGRGHYYWYYEDDAISWGNHSKNATGYYEIYRADIDCSEVLDTVFNEEHYLFWIEAIEKFSTKTIRQGKEVTIKELNSYFKEQGIFGDATGVMFQEVPKNDNRVLVKGLYYKKRIQIAIYKINIIDNFAFHYENKCIKP